MTLCLCRDLARLAALPIAGVAIALTPLAARPDILIERTASNVAVRAGNDQLVPASSRRGRFAAEAWLRADGDAISLAEAARRPGWTCIANICRTTLKGRRILYAHEGKVPVRLDCAADILIADFPLRGQCREVPVRIDRFDVWRSGAYALIVDGDGVAIRTARAEQGRRPWVIVPTPRKKVSFAPATRRCAPPSSC